MTDRAAELWLGRVEASFVDKRGWQFGPWSIEPDLVEWLSVDSYHLVIARATLGALCGYVGVPVGHTEHGRGAFVFDSGRPPLLGEYTVHGGITFAGHAPGTGGDVHPGGFWFLGFHCANAFDTLPQCPIPSSMAPGIDYRSITYVRREVEALAAQLARTAKDPPHATP